MREFRQYVSQLSELGNLTAELSVHTATQAVYVEPDPDWQLLWLLHANAAITEDELIYLAHVLRDFEYGRVPEAYLSKIPRTAGIQYPPVAYPHYDFAWFDDRLKKVFRKEYPLWVRVHLCARLGMDAEQYRAERRAIEAVMRAFTKFFTITLEERSLAVLAAAGDYVLGTAPGTMGGYLQDGGTTHYGVTCEHVAPKGSSVRDRTGSTLGTVRQASRRSVRPAGVLCRPASPGMNSMDAALFPMLMAPAQSGFGGHTASFGSGQFAQMKGAVSGGPHTYYIGGLGLVHTMHHAGNDYCFKDLFSIRTSLSSSSLPLSAAVAMSPIPLPGDSGSWISMKAGNPLPDWIGMLIGVDAVEGFAFESSEIVRWASRAVGSPLTVW
jgi:hypothetical protein